MPTNAKSPDVTDVYVGSRVRLKRVMLGFSQERLAEHLGITFQQVQKYERGINRIGASRLQTIATVLGVNIGFFFDQEEKARNGASAHTAADLSSFLKSRQGVTLNRCFLKISDPDVRMSFLNLVRSLADAQDGSGVAEPSLHKVDDSAGGLQNMGSRTKDSGNAAA